jgi:hypothetical protein
LNNSDVSPSINGLSDHDGQMLTLQFAQQHIKDQCLYYKRLINQITINDFLLKLSQETWASVFEGNDVNTIFNSFLNTFLKHYYSSFPVIKVNNLPSRNSWNTSGICTSCQHKRALYMELKKKTITQYLRNILEIIVESSQELYKKQIKWNMIDIF